MKNARAILSCVLAVAMPISLAGQNLAAAGMLYSSGKINVNGKPVSQSTALFGGDLIETSQAAASIALKGSRIAVPGNSVVQVSPESVQVQCGSAAISTQNGMRAKVGSMTVQPTGATATFEVTQGRSEILIASLQGGVNVFDGVGTQSLAAGSMLRLPSAGCAMMDAASPEPQAQGSNNAISRTTGIALGVGAVVAGTVAAFVIANMRDPASPNTP